MSHALAAADLDAGSVRATAELAYLYAYPMLVGYGFMHTQIGDVASSMHQGINRLHHFRELGGPKRLNAIPWINNDTPYGAGWLDLHAEPFVLSLPEFPPQRFHNVQLIDLFTHNFAFFGTRTSGNAAQRVLIAGPGWQGALPAGIEHVTQAETRFVKIVTRILLERDEDAASVRALEDGYRLEPLSAWRVATAQQRAGDAAAPITWPAPGTQARVRPEPPSAEFIGLFNALLALCQPAAEERHWFARFADIGIGAGRPFDAAQLAPDQRAAIDEGVAAAYARIAAKARRLDQRINGWEMPLALRGNRVRMAADEAALLNRAAAAMYAIWGVDAEEGLYMVCEADADGAPLDGTAREYTLRFDAPLPVRAFWSFTVYDAATRLLVEHPSGRYAVRDRGLQTDANGGFTLHLAHREPDAPLPAASAWLPVPARPFQLVARLYWPREELLDGRWRPPPVRRRRPT
jgi:hypothetical protein